MLWGTDIYIGQLTDLLKQKHMYANTLIVYSADNGGTAGGNNFPLRGFKRTVNKFAQGARGTSQIPISIYFAKFGALCRTGTAGCAWRLSLAAGSFQRHFAAQATTCASIL